MAFPFAYIPLTSPESTRVLDIEPAPDHNDPIHVKLREISLLPHIDQTAAGDHPSYDALSYVWGAKKGTRPIICNEAQFLVTPNCEVALRYLRRTSPTKSLWVDAICIDQSSNDEKSQQVGRMGKIYQWADLVIVWLGEEDELTPVAFRYLRQLSLKEASRNKSNSTLTRMMYRGWSSLLTKKNDELVLGSPQRGYLRDMLCRPYFQRFWTLQELAMGRSAIVVCGSRPLTWSTFASGADLFLNGNGPQYSGFYGPNGTDKIAGFFGHYLCWLMLYETMNNHSVPPMNREQLLLHVKFLITASHSHQTSNPKDRVFALYNMFKVVGIELPRPDYNKCEPTIHREATVTIIRQTFSLSIFEFFPPKGSSQSPSWVHSFESPDGREGYEQWAACQNSQVDIHLLPRDDAELSLRGIEYSAVLHMAPPVIRQTETALTENPPNSAEIFAIASSIRYWYDCARAFGLNSHPRTNENPQSAFFHTVVNQPCNWGLATNQLWNVTQCLYDAAQSLDTGPINTTLSGGEDDSGVRLLSAVALLPNAPPSHLVNRFLYTFWQFYESKRFFVTESGCFGTGPGRIEINDSVVLFAGATMPMILRRNETNTRLIGPCYVHGIMRGEAWPGTPLLQLPTFSLS